MGPRGPPGAAGAPVSTKSQWKRGGGGKPLCKKLLWKILSIELNKGLKYGILFSLRALKVSKDLLVSLVNLVKL